MAIANYELWPFAPNWDTPFTESLQWLTDILTSDDGSEQRRALRYMPRRSFDFATVVEGTERAFLDNLLTSNGAGTWYLPMWHDVTITTGEAAAGLSVVPVGDIVDTGLVTGAVAVLFGESAFDYELVQIDSIAGDITLVDPLAKRWPAGTRLMPVRAAELSDQPEQQKHNDRLTTADVQFKMVEPQARLEPLEVVSDLTETYGGFHVIPYEPNEARKPRYTLLRNLDEFDNMSGIPVQRDIAGRGFHQQEFTLHLEGRAEHKRFENTLLILRGRAVPMWVPSFNQDFVIAGDIAVNSDLMTVERCGFALSGGPRDDLKVLMIETATGRYFREILDVAESGGNEILLLDQVFAAGLAASDVVRICFMTLMRLVSDTVQIEHHSDRIGVSSVKFSMRSAPNTRIPVGMPTELCELIRPIEAVNDNNDGFIDAPPLAPGTIYFIGSTWDGDNYVNVTKSETSIADLFNHNAGATGKLLYDFDISDLPVGDTLTIRWSIMVRRYTVDSNSYNWPISNIAAMHFYDGVGTRINAYSSQMDFTPVVTNQVQIDTWDFTMSQQKTIASEATLRVAIPIVAKTATAGILVECTTLNPTLCYPVNH